MGRSTSIAALLAACLVACKTPQRVPTPASQTGVMEAIGVIRYGLDSTERLLALPNQHVVRLTEAAFLGLPKHSGSAIGAYAAAETHLGAVLWLATASFLGSQPWVRISKVQMGNKEPSEAVDVQGAPTPADVACASEAWLAAFFIEGVGRAPTAPVVLRYRAGDVWHRLVVDPVRHTLMNPPTLVMPNDQMTDGWLSKPIVFSSAGSASRVIPMMLTRDLFTWSGHGSTTDGSFDLTAYSSHNGDDPVISERRLYLWRLPPGCESWYPARP